ncbi:hypothetical protein SUSAZ_01665 [Sulfolobus acidocaldarius SUSAZ]|nr:hypothetical protein SUSAZ_01665 [Sulfolobus acidocaldarius SUSAZ]
MLAKEVTNTAKLNPKESLKAIIMAMEEKTKFLRSLNINSENDVRQLFDSVFYARKHFNYVLEKNGIGRIREAYNKLKDKSLNYSERLKLFSSLVSEEPEDILDMAREIIHFLEPEQYPLWTRWIWNDKKNTGSITYVLMDNVKLNSKDDYFEALKELREILSVFGLDTNNYFSTSIFLVYAYVRYVDYATLLAVDRKGGGLYPPHLSTTAMVLGLKSFLKVIKVANS